MEKQAMNAKTNTMLLAALVILSGLATLPASAIDVTAPVIEGCAQLPRDRCSRGQGLLSMKGSDDKDSRIASLASVTGSLSGLGLGGFSVASEAPPVEKNPKGKTAESSPQANTGGGDAHTVAPTDRDNGKVRIAEAPQANTGNGGRNSIGRDEQGRNPDEAPANRKKPFLHAAQ